MRKQLENESETLTFAYALGHLLQGGEVIELIGDVGAGKTTFTKGLALGLGVKDDVQSPTFTISRVYDGHNELTLAHYDFYRLTDPGILRMELSEIMRDPRAITVIEWAEIVEGVLPANRIRIAFSALTEHTRVLQIDGPEEIISKL